MLYDERVYLLNIYTRVDIRVIMYVCIYTWKLEPLTVLIANGPMNNTYVFLLLLFTIVIIQRVQGENNDHMYAGRHDAPSPVIQYYLYCYCLEANASV